MKKVLGRLGAALVVFVATTVFWAFVIAERAPHQITVEGPSYGPDGPPFVGQRHPSVAARSEPPAVRLVLIGDAGEPPGTNGTNLETLREWTGQYPDETTTVLLGDNVYPAGFDPRAPEEAAGILGAQLDAIDGRALVIPGNHDWHRRPERVHAQQEYVSSREDAEMLPTGACPGPTVVTLGNPARLHLVVIDTEWFFQPRSRPSCDTSPHETVRALARLGPSLSDAPVIVAAHHPMRTAGPHGGYKRSIGRRLWQTLFGAQGTLGAPLYRSVMDDLRAAFAALRPLAYAAGHDHTLQVIEGRERDNVGYFLVSGAGAADRVTDVTALPETLFAHAHAGFLVLDVHEVGETNEVGNANHESDAGGVMEALDDIDVTDVTDEPTVPELFLTVVEAGRGAVWRTQLAWLPSPAHP